MSANPIEALEGLALRADELAVSDATDQVPDTKMGGAPDKATASQCATIDTSDIVCQCLSQLCAHLDETFATYFQKLSLQITSRQDELLRAIHDMPQLPKRHDSVLFAMESRHSTYLSPKRRVRTRETCSLNAFTPREEDQAADGPDGGQPYPDLVSTEALDGNETPDSGTAPAEIYERMPFAVVDPPLQGTHACRWLTETQISASEERALAGVWSGMSGSSTDVGPLQNEPADNKRKSRSVYAPQADSMIPRREPVEFCSETSSQCDGTPRPTIYGNSQQMQPETASDAVVDSLVCHEQGLKELRADLVQTNEEAGQQRQQQNNFMALFDGVFDAHRGQHNNHAAAPEPPQEERPTTLSLGSRAFRDMVNRPSLDDETQSTSSQRVTVRSNVSSALSKLSGPCREKLDVYKLDALITDELVDAEQRTFLARFAAVSSARADSVNNDDSSNNRKRRNEEAASADVDVILAFTGEGDADTKMGSGGQTGTEKDVGGGMCLPVSKRLATVKLSNRFDQARQTQEDMIIQNFAESEKTSPPAEVMPGTSIWLLDLPLCVLILFGILSFRKSRVWMRHGLLVMACTCLTFTFSFLHMFRQGNFLAGSIGACYALGGFVGLYSLKQQRIGELLGPQSNILEIHARSNGFYKMWQRGFFRSFLIVTGLWFWAVVCAFWWTDVWNGVQVEALGLAAAFIFVSGLLSALTLCQLHVCVGMELMVDNFCIQFLHSSDVDVGVAQWNILQALLRRAAYSIDVCFLVVNTSVLTVLLLTGLDFVLNATSQARALRSLSSTVPMVLLMLYCQYRAAAVTEKCSRTPALVNSVVVDKVAVDFKRQYMVQFILHSAAGFYMKGVRLTAFMVLKFAYVTVMLAVGLAMRIVSDAR